MSKEMIVLLVLIGIVALITAGTIIADVLRKKDFKDQVSGKKAERKMDDKKKISYDGLVEEDPQRSIEREVLRTRSGQNLLGPK